MDFKLTEEQIMIQQAARDFAQTELLPGVIERDEHSKFPTEQVKMMADLGFLGMMVDPKYGGAGLDSVSYVLAIEEIAKIDDVVFDSPLSQAGVYWYLNSMFPVWIRTHILSFPYPNRVIRGTLKLLNFA